jgi:3-oxoadipate enol-lactonase
MPTAKVGDINLYYEIHGRGEPLVLIMGYATHIGWWFRQIPAFSDHFKVVVFDNRGSGRSDKPDIPYTMEMMAGDLAGLLDAIGVGGAHIFGISLGGSIAQHFALDHPGRVISLVLGCTTCGGPQSVRPTAGITALTDFERLRRLTPEERAREMLTIEVSREFIEQNPAMVEQIIAKKLEHVTPLHCYSCQLAAARNHSTCERLPEIKAPTLVIAGDADRMIPVENSKILASRIPNAELVILKGSGHCFFWDAAEEANSAILDFLERHQRPRS